MSVQSDYSGVRVGDKFVLTDPDGTKHGMVVTRDSNGNSCPIPKPTKPVPVGGRMPHDTRAVRKNALLSRASSRRELVALMHDVVLPLLTQHANNMEFLKRRYDEMEARLKAIEPVPPSEEPHV